MERHRVGIVIPALNEAATIGKVVENVSPFGLAIVVDDGSQDETRELAEAAGAAVVRHPDNRGYDEALNSGFACADKLGCEYVITMDADGQHDSNMLATFITALDDGGDVVVGIREYRQRVAEHIFAWVASIKWGIRDPMCGMKAYRITVYRELGHFDSSDSIGTELTFYAANSGRRIVQLPVKTRERTSQPRFGRRYSANKRILQAVWRSLRAQRLPAKAST